MSDTPKLADRESDSPIQRLLRERRIALLEYGIKTHDGSGVSGSCTIYATDLAKLLKLLKKLTRQQGARP
jgi:hypothetical protein